MLKSSFVIIMRFLKTLSNESSSVSLGTAAANFNGTRRASRFPASVLRRALLAIAIATLPLPAMSAFVTGSLCYLERPTVTVGTADTCAEFATPVNSTVSPTGMLHGYCWGKYVGSLPTAESGNNWRALEVGYGGSGCGIREDGSATCWVSTEHPDLPVAPSVAPLEFVSISTGVDVACGRLSDATARCWGHVVNPTGGRPVRSISAGGVYSNGGVCAIFEDDGSCQCFPSPGTTTACAPLPAGEQWVLVETGMEGACGLTDSGNILCWGTGTDTPPSLPDGQHWVQISTGGWGHNCGLRSDGTAVCWGGNEYAQIDVPALSANETWVQVAARGFSTCGSTSTGRILCWGMARNFEGFDYGSVKIRMPLYRNAEACTHLPTTSEPEPTTVCDAGDPARATNIGYYPVTDQFVSPTCDPSWEPCSSITVAGVTVYVVPSSVASGLSPEPECPEFAVSLPPASDSTR